MEQWCAKTGNERGEVITLEKTWDLAGAWYGGRMQADYRGRTTADVQAVLEGVGLRSEFWRF